MKKIFERIFLVAFIAMNFIFINKASAATIEYRGGEFDVIPASRIKTTTVAGVESTIANGKVTFTVSIPSDTTSWKEQVSDTQTENYVYSGVYITPPCEEATKYDAIFDAESQFPYYGLTPDSEIEEGKEYAIGLTKGEVPGFYVVGDRTNGNMSLFGEKTYISVIYWYNEDNEYITREYFEVERVNADSDANVIERTTIDSSRISLVENQDNVKLEGNTLTLGKDFTGTTVKLKITKPNNGVSYSHYFTYGTEVASLADDYAIITVSITNSELYSNIDWYINETTSVTFESLNLVVKGETTSYQDENETIYLVSEDNALLPMYKLVVDEITDEAQIKSVQDLLKSNETLINLYDINLLDGNNSVIKLENGNYLIKVKLTDELKKFENLQIVYVDENGQVAERLDAKIEDGYVTFTTTHLSTYGIVALSEVENPQTYDSIIAYRIMTICAIMGIVGSALYIKSTKKKRFN